MKTDPVARDPLPLAGRVVIVTGVSRRQGIGYAVACRLAAYGASVVCHHFEEHDDAQPWGGDDVGTVLDGVASHLVGSARLVSVGGDLTVEGAPEALVSRAVDKFGCVDGLVCNQALSGSDGALGELDAQMLDRHYAVNTRTSILLAQAFASVHSADAPGSIVFMTSGQGLGPMPGEVAYAASKAALAGITWTLSGQLGAEGIRVNTVNPGPVNTGYGTPQMWEQLASRFPGGLAGEPDDPAKLIAWLLTDEASWITGQVINSEGGFRR
ncbi:SDR family oxidoreductase [Galactobacter sp.]|uniref:SDR family oxidoreductase n=1 Tax=Galactobacter sp. TaxID=2676125 RepID=UPI0025BD11E6|nr:SDR family oxidoreductase [Galactobacter sp.]